MESDIGVTWEEALAEGRMVMLDGEHGFRWLYGNAAHYEEDASLPCKDDMVLIGIMFCHRDRAGNACGGLCSFRRRLDGSDRGDGLWKVTSLEPLTITPSVKCVGDWCAGGAHGFITNGVWVPVSDDGKLGPRA